MKDKFTQIVITFVIIGIVSVLAIFGVIIFQEISDSIPKEASSGVENFKTQIADQDDEESEETNESTSTLFGNVESYSNKNEGNEQEDEYDSSTSQYKKYFYHQLDATSKTIYEALNRDKNNMKTGTYKVDLGNSFSYILNKENGEEELGRYYQSAIEAFTYDNPEVFYLDPNKMYLNIETTTKGSQKTYNVFINSGNEENYLINEFSDKEQIDNALNQIEEVKEEILNNATGDTYDDIKMVHDYLVDNISYDTTLQKENIYNVYGALINGESVCEGYARSFKYLLDEMGIPCILGIGKGTNSQGNTENHAWNYVELDGDWYAIDTTWDDPITNGGWFMESSKYKYFLKGENDFNKDHVLSGQFTEGGKVFEYPEFSKNNY